MIRVGLRTLLLAEATISAIVGATGVYIARAPQEAGTTRLEIHLVNDDENKTLGGKQTDAAEIFSADIDIDCKAATAFAAVTLATAVKDFLRDYSGAAGSQTISAVNLNSVGASAENPIDGSDVARHTTTLDFTIHWKP